MKFGNIYRSFTLLTSSTLPYTLACSFQRQITFPTCTTLTMPRAPILALTHGGGPMPILGDEGQKEITDSLRGRAAKELAVTKPAAILLVTAHWEERITTLTTAAHPKLYYDYYGFPPEAYSLKYPAPGAPEVAEKIITLLAEKGIKSTRDAERGWDHGVFVPLSLARPQADIPIVQMSVLSSQSVTELFALGEALSSLRDQNIVIVGSGSASFHNLRHFFTGLAHDGSFKTLHAGWRGKLDAALRHPKATDRLNALKEWRKWEGSDLMHPPGRSEHFSPLVVCAGAAGDVDESKDVVDGWIDAMVGLKMQNWAWKSASA